MGRPNKERQLAPKVLEIIAEERANDLMEYPGYILGCNRRFENEVAQPEAYHKLRNQQKRLEDSYYRRLIEKWL